MHINASVINVLNRANIFYYDRYTNVRVNQLLFAQLKCSHELLTTPMTRVFSIAYLLLTLRYVVIAGIAFLIFYSIKPARLLRLRIQNTFPKKKDYYREIGYSMLSFIFFAGYFCPALQKSGKAIHTHIRPCFTNGLALFFHKYISVHYYSRHLFLLDTQAHAPS